MNWLAWAAWPPLDEVKFKEVAALEILLKLAATATTQDHKDVAYHNGCQSLKQFYSQ